MGRRTNISGECLEYTMYNLCISMPKDRESCYYCPCLKYDNDTETRRCKFTWELIPFPNSMMGEHCPLEKSKED